MKNHYLTLGLEEGACLVKYNSNDYSGAIIDFTKAISLDPKDDFSYLYRGCAELLLNQRQKACLDWNIAKKYGNKKAIVFINKYCN